MHCDRVYAILTRGPFPSGEVTDVAVEIHLAHCIDCRRLAEALRPLERDPHEPAAEESAQLPGYRGDHQEWSSALGAPSVAQKLKPAARWIRRGPRLVAPVHVGRLIAALLIGATIGVVLTTVNKSGASVERFGIAGASFAGRDTDGWTGARVQAQLIYGLNLPRACSKLDMQLFYPLTTDDRSPTLSESPPSFVNQCCTQCHVAGGGTKVAFARRSKLITSCTICHDGAARAQR